MRRGKASSKMDAARACAAMVKFLEGLTPQEVAAMRDRMRDRGMKPEESRVWSDVGSGRRARGWVRTRTGAVYR